MSERAPFRGISPPRLTANPLVAAASSRLKQDKQRKLSDIKKKLPYVDSGRLQELEAKVYAVEGRVGAVDNKVDCMATDVDQLKGTLQTLANQISEQQTTLQYISEKLEALGQGADTAQSQRAPRKASK